MATAFGMLFCVKHGTTNAGRQVARVHRAYAVPFTTNAELRSPIATFPSAAKISGASVTKGALNFKSGEWSLAILTICTHCFCYRPAFLSDVKLKYL